jgi:cytochrome b6-f complex iron-sulfur subunit
MDQNLKPPSIVAMENHNCHGCEVECALPEHAPSARRRFLQGVAATAGGLVLGMQMAAHAEGETADQSTPAPGAGVELQLTLPEKVLESVGAFEVVEYGDAKIIVARSGPSTIVACSAVCTHKGGILDYDHESRQFVCPSHSARFDTAGKVVKGPAKLDLKSYQTRVVLGLAAPAEEPE